MSPGPADQINAKELSARAAVVERVFDVGQFERVREAGGSPGTRVHAALRFGSFEGRTTVGVRVEGAVQLRCERCLRPCECAVDETAVVMIVRDEVEEVPGGYESHLGLPEQLSLSALIEEQVLLALPLVPMHAAGDAQCLAGASAAPNEAVPAAGPGARAADEEETQMPFANLRELLEKKNER